MYVIFGGLRERCHSSDAVVLQILLYSILCLVLDFPTFPARSRGETRTANRSPPAPVNHDAEMLERERLAEAAGFSLGGVKSAGGGGFRLK